MPLTICGVGERYFAPTFAIGGAYPLVYFFPSPFVARAKNISPLRSQLVACNRLSVSAPHHLWHGRKIFRPCVRHWYATSTATFQITAHVTFMGCMLHKGTKYFARATITTRSRHEHLAHKQLNAIGIIVQQCLSLSCLQPIVQRVLASFIHRTVRCIRRFLRRLAPKPP